MKNIFLLLFLLFSLISCKRWQKQYPEDTERTKVTPLERLAGGKYGKWWTLSKVTLNGIEVTNEVKDTFGEYKVRFSGPNEIRVGEWQNTGYYVAPLKDTGDIYWAFSSDESGIGSWGIHQRDIYSYVLIPYSYHKLDVGSPANSSIILKLSSSEFKLSLTNKRGDSTIINYFTN